MPNANIELEKVVDNLIECRRKLFQAVIKANQKVALAVIEDVVNGFIEKLKRGK